MFCCYIPPVDLLLLVSQKAAFSSTAAQIPQNKKTLNSHIKKTILISWPDITGLHKLKGYIYIYIYIYVQPGQHYFSQSKQNILLDIYVHCSLYVDLNFFNYYSIPN